VKQQPKYRVYVADDDGKIDYKNETFALWENTTRDGSKTYFAGKTRSGHKVQMWPVTPREEPEDVDGAPF